MNKIISPLLIVLTGILSCSQVVAQSINANVEDATPNERYEVHDDGTVTDRWTNLMWQQCSLGLSGVDCAVGSPANVGWQEAMQRASSDTTADYSDWRLPNIKELQSLVAYNRLDPSINTTVFPESQSSHYLSSSLVPHSSTGVYALNFNTGNTLSIGRSSGAHVRLVRDAD